MVRLVFTDVITFSTKVPNLDFVAFYVKIILDDVSLFQVKYLIN